MEGQTAVASEENADVTLACVVIGSHLALSHREWSLLQSQEEFVDKFYLPPGLLIMGTIPFQAYSPGQTLGEILT